MCFLACLLACLLAYLHACISGLNFNTPDSLVFEYLNKHGKVAHNKVIYDTEKDGPLKRMVLWTGGVLR